NGGMDLSSSDLELTADGSSIQAIGTRFANISIPQGSQILEAYVQFTVDEVNTTGDIDVVIALENADHAGAITATANNLANRNYTDSIIWNNIAAWSTVGNAGTDQRTPDISLLLQQITDRQGWSTGNAVLVTM